MTFDEEMDDLSYWRLCDELSVLEASLLVINRSPAKYHDVENFSMEQRPEGYDATKNAIIRALQKNKITGRLRVVRYVEENQAPDDIVPSVSLVDSRVEVASLKEWLAGRGFRRGFFFPEKIDAPDYLDPTNPRFARKLAAAVRAWQAVVNPGSRHPKTALTKWLREHAEELGLIDDEGKPNETGIDEAAKVANWQPSGGAPKTPSGQESPLD